MFEKQYMDRVTKKTTTTRTVEYSDDEDKSGLAVLFIVSLIVISIVWSTLAPSNFMERAVAVIVVLAVFLSVNFYRARVVKEETVVEERE